MTNYHFRKVCEEEGAAQGEPGYGLGKHYFYGVQVDTVDTSVSCPAHAGSATRDFVIEKIEVV